MKLLVCDRYYKYIADISSDVGKNHVRIDIPHIRYWEPTEGASSPLRRQWRPLAAI